MIQRKGAKEQRSKGSFFLSLPLCLFALSLLLLSFSLRFHLLGAQSFWNDEGNSYVQALRPLTEIPFHAARDIHPPGYYWLLHLWRLAAGDTEFGLRSLSAFASVLTVAFTLSLGRRLYGPLAGLAAALFVALNTFQIHYAQEARMYALLALWGVAGLWALVGLIQQQNVQRMGATHESPLRQRATIRWALALALINAAGLWTQYAYPFVMLAQGGVFVVWLVECLVGARRVVPGYAQDSRTQHAAPLQILGVYILANLLTILLYLPWLPNALTSVTTWPSTGQPVPLNEALSMILGWFTLGMTARVIDPSWVAVGLLLVLLGLRIGQPGQKLWRVLLPAAGALIPVGLFLALGLFREGNLKFLLPAQVAFALWMGRGVWVLAGLDVRDIRSRVDGDQQITAAMSTFIRFLPRAAALIVVLGLAVNLWRGLEPLYHHPDFQRDNYRGVAADITATLDADDAIILDAPNQEEVFRYYYAGDVPVYALPAGLGGDDAQTQAAVEHIVQAYDQIYVVFWGETERDPNRVVESTLNTQAYEASSQWYGDVRLVRYATPQEPTITRTVDARFGDSITLQSYALSESTVSPGEVLQLRLNWRTGAPLDARYKVFVQLLDEQGGLVTQRDSEPGGNLALTTTWQPGETIIDHHALIIPNDLTPAHYTLIIGLYALDDPQQRLRMGDADHFVIDTIQVQHGEG